MPAEAQLDQDILQVLKEMSPSTAYLVGFEDYAGRVFVPSRSNVNRVLRIMRSLRRRAKTELQKKTLDSAEEVMRFDEPQPVLEDIVSSIFAHLVKEQGVNEERMLSLLTCAWRAIEARRASYQGMEVSTALKALVLYRYTGFRELLDVVRKESKDPRVKKACRELKSKGAEYAELFRLRGFGAGEFPRVEKIFRRSGFELGREKAYPRILRRAFDYHETPRQLEANALAWIDEELPKYERVTEKLAKAYGCEPDPDKVEAALNSRIPLDPKKLLRTTAAARKVVQRFVDRDMCRINPKYRTKLIETPSYLTGTMPSGAAQFFDTYTKKPFQIFFQTTDPRRDPDRAIPALINLLVHEEYGHCVHHSNSALGFLGSVEPLRLYPGLPIGCPITEGLSLNREIEFFEVSEALEEKLKKNGMRGLSTPERDYVRLAQKYGGLELLNLELEFWTRRWRLIRFLRVVGDVRVNTGSQGLVEFLDWAKEHTGVPRASMYFQLFPAHEGMFPGYATCYAVVGQEIREMERKIKDNEKRIKFSTYLCSIGFPPRSLYRRMLQDYARKVNDGN